MNQNKTSTVKIYTVIPKALGHISTWPEKIPHAFSPSTDVILLQPITKEGPSMSPYAADDYFSLNTDIANSIDEVIEIGLKYNVGIGVDLVYNHVHPEGKMAQDNPDWIQRNPDGSMKHAGYHLNHKWIAWWDLVLRDCSLKEVQEQIMNYSNMWAQVAYKTGGIIRLDNLHSSDTLMTKKILTMLQEEYPGVHVSGEYFGDPKKLPEYQELGVDSFLGMQYYEPFCNNIKFYLEKMHRSGVPHFLPISTHDSKAPAVAYGQVESTLPRYVISALMNNSGMYGLTMWNEYAHPNNIKFIGEKIRKKPNKTLDFLRQFELVDEYVNDFIGEATFSTNGSGILKVERNNGHCAYVNLNTRKAESFEGINLPPCGVQIDERLIYTKRWNYHCQ